MNTRRKALVLGSVSRTVLAVIRSLGRGGVEVHVGWSDAGCISRRSRYVRHAHELPPYDESSSVWLTALCDLMERERFDLVIPCSDRDTIACWRRRAALLRSGRVYAPNDEACEILFDKHKTNALARSVGVRTPREILVSSPEQAREAFAQLGAPLVLKPRQTFDLERGVADLRVLKASTADELDRILEQLLPHGPVAIQQNFVGSGAGVELLLADGEPLLAFQHMRVHEPLPGGQSAYRRSVPLCPDLLKASCDLLRPLRYTGVAMVEFKVDTASGRWVFIEVNARFWGSLPLAVAAGADFPLSLFQFLVEGRVAFPQGYRYDVYCRNLPLDLEWQIANLQADRSDRTLATLPLARVLAEAFVNVFTLRERIDSWSLRDPAPAFAELGQLARRALHRLGGRAR